MTENDDFSYELTGTSFPELLRVTVLEPLGMKHSTYEQPLPASSIPRAASAYREDGKKIEGGWHIYPEMAAAGLWTTPSDLARFAIEIQKSHRGESNQVLSSSMARAMLTKGLNGWGLGPALEGEGGSLRFGHGGANEGFRCQLVAYLHRGQGAVVMTNSDNGRALIEEILQAIAMAWEWSDFQPRD